MKEQSAYWLALISFVISIITMTLFFIKVSPNSIVDGLTFISIIAAFIGASVTLVIGFQIYSTIAIKDRLKHIESISNDLVKTKNNLVDLEMQLKGQIAETDAKSNAKNKRYATAFTSLHTSLRYYCNLDMMKEVIPPILKLLGIYADQICKDEFNPTLINKEIDLLFISLNNDSTILKTTKYYWLIKDDYEVIFSRTYDLLNSYKEENDQSR